MQPEITWNGGWDDACIGNWPASMEQGGSVHGRLAALRAGEKCGRVRAGGPASRGPMAPHMLPYQSKVAASRLMLCG